MPPDNSGSASTPADQPDTDPPATGGSGGHALNEKAFDFVQDVTKQLVTLASGIIAFTITFYKDFATGANQSSRHLMTGAWVVFLISICFGLLVLLALAGALTSSDTKKRNPSNPNARDFSRAQQFFFVAALILTVVAGCQANLGPAPEPSPQQCCCCSTTTTTNSTTHGTTGPTSAPVRPTPDTGPTPDPVPPPPHSSISNTPS